MMRKKVQKEPEIAIEDIPIKIRPVSPIAFQEDHDIKEIHMLNLIPFYGNRVVVREDNGEHVTNIPEDMDGLKFKKWLQTPSGIFSKDLLAWTREKAEAKYFMIKSNNMQSVVRLIDEEEVLKMNALGLLHGKLKDSYYMHLKTVGINQNIRGSERYISESNSNAPVEEAELETNTTIYDENYSSESLFE